MKYENLKEFIRSTRSSKSTIYRFYNKNEELHAETKMKGNKRIYPEDHIRYFSSEIMHDENKVLRQENNSMKNLIDCLVNKDSLQYRLWQLNWSFFFTVSYKLDRDKKGCFRQMHGLYEFLVNKYGENTELRIFFSTEPFANRKGNHNHFVLQVGDKRMEEEIKNDVQTYFSYDRVDVSVYDKYKAGIFYASKNGLVNDDWDIMGNNLKGDNVNEN
ncbi:MAG: hypothetical protein ACOH1O_03385 [Flavobacterium sp.]